MLIFLIEIKPYRHNRNSKDTGTGTERDEAIHPASNGSSGGLQSLSKFQSTKGNASARTSDADEFHRTPAPTPD